MESNSYIVILDGPDTQIKEAPSSTPHSFNSWEQARDRSVDYLNKRILNLDTESMKANTVAHHRYWKSLVEARKRIVDAEFSIDYFYPSKNLFPKNTQH